MLDGADACHLLVTLALTLMLMLLGLISIVLRVLYRHDFRLALQSCQCFLSGRLPNKCIQPCLVHVNPSIELTCTDLSGKLMVTCNVEGNQEHESVSKARRCSDTCCERLEAGGSRGKRRRGALGAMGTRRPLAAEPALKAAWSVAGSLPVFSVKLLHADAQWSSSG